MALDILNTADVIETLENFLARKRPPENMRAQLDLDYKIENQSVIIYEVRPRWNNANEKIESPIAKTTWVKSRQKWKIFWMRADLKWHLYQPVPEVKTISEFIQTVNEDTHSCFWG